MAAIKGEITRDRISQLARTITVRLRESISDIQAVNDDIHVLSINAKILAAKAGSSGKAFAVVADAVRGMAGRTERITAALQTGVESTVGELTELNRFLGTKVRAARLSQVAESMIDVVDRNLYERSCDVRWWATEAAVSRALEEPSPESARTCAERLGVILDSYTVYLDIVVCDLAGHVVANGRPEKYANAGLSVSDSVWFTGATRTADGSEFGFQGVHRCALAGGARALVYSCGVRAGGRTAGPLVGVIGIIFNWDALGAVVSNRAASMLAGETDQPVRAFIAYPDGAVIASSGEDSPARIQSAIVAAIGSSTRGIVLPDAANDTRSVRDAGGRAGIHAIAGYAVSAGYETYRTGWIAVVQEDVDGAHE